MAAVRPSFSPDFLADDDEAVNGASSGDMSAAADDSWRKALSFGSPPPPVPSHIAAMAAGHQNKQNPVPAAAIGEAPGPRRLRVYLRVRPLLASEAGEAVCLSQASQTEVQMVAPEVSLGLAVKNIVQHDCPK